jgi:hypothetical protein
MPQCPHPSLLHYSSASPPHYFSMPSVPPLHCHSARPFTAPPLFHCPTGQMFRCLTSPPSHFPSVPLTRYPLSLLLATVLLSDSSTASLLHSSTGSLPRYSTASLAQCPTFALCSTVPLSCCHSVPMFRVPLPDNNTVPLLHSPSVPVSHFLLPKRLSNLLLHCSISPPPSGHWCCHIALLPTFPLSHIPQFQCLAGPQQNHCPTPSLLCCSIASLLHCLIAPAPLSDCPPVLTMSPFLCPPISLFHCFPVSVVDRIAIPLFHCPNCRTAPHCPCVILTHVPLL